MTRFNPAHITPPPDTTPEEAERYKREQTRNEAEQRDEQERARNKADHREQGETPAPDPAKPVDTPDPMPPD